MAKAMFRKEALQSLVNGEECNGLEVVQDRIVATGRWTIQYHLVFKDKDGGKFYETGYRRGATEQQDEGPFEYEPDAIECDEVRPVEKVVIVYERIAE